MKPYSKKAVRVQNRNEAKGYLERFAKDNVDVILQEFVIGDADQHYFIDGFRDCDGIIRGLLSRRYFRSFTRSGLLVPSNFRSMGFAIAAAVGAKLGNPNREVVALIGDGGMQLSGLQRIAVNGFREIRSSNQCQLSRLWQ